MHAIASELECLIDSHVTSTVIQSTRTSKREVVNNIRFKLDVGRRAQLLLDVRLVQISLDPLHLSRELS